MGPLSGKRTSPEVERWLQEAREGSGESLRKTLAVCREYLVAIAAEELPGQPGREAEARDLANDAFLEVQKLLSTFDGTSEAELCAWLRQILLDQTVAQPGRRRPSELEHGDLSTPDHGAFSSPETRDSAPPGASPASMPLASRQPVERAILPEDLTRSAPKTTLDQTPSLAADSDDGPPPALAKLEGFAIADKVGHGGMGIVYRAWQERLQRWVALKCLPPAFAEDPERLRRFRQEAHLAAQLTEHGILQVYDVLEAGHTPILVLPYIEGSDLARIISQRRALRDGKEVKNPHPWATKSDADYLAQILPFFDKVLDALVRLHGAGVLHRDLKPSNILVDKNGNGWLTDFGLARLSQSETMTQPGKRMGTPGFMSPEQWEGDDDVDARTDVFGMGATLYQALLLELPYGKARLTPRTPPAQIARTQQRYLPANMDLVLLEATHPDRKQRYQSAPDLRDDWQRVRKALLPQTARLGPGRRLVHAARRRPSQIVAALALVVVAVLAAILLTPAPIGTPPPGPLVVRTVHLKTKPPGAKVALVPLSPEDGTPQFDKALQPSGLTPVAVPNVPPGEYLVIVEVEKHGFHEVFRKVPAPGESRPTFTTKIFPHTTFDERDDKSVDLPLITVPKADVWKGMALFAGGEFIMGNADFGPAVAPPHLRPVEPFYLDTTEVTVATYQSAREDLPERMRVLALAPDMAVCFVTLDEAVRCAEGLGKRLPDEVEYEFAATNGGKDRFPWGKELDKITPWAFGPVGLPAHDRSAVNGPVCGLFSNVAEWTSSWAAPYPGAEWPADLKAEAPNQRIVRGGPFCVIQGDPQPQGRDRRETWDARYRLGIPRDDAFRGLGFRCARSFKPRFPVAVGK
jgi:formylglycine-generating enzyme required for sulfatase activity/DNA-directed RNA polymerase specialized sigma24 family protein